MSTKWYSSHTVILVRVSVESIWATNVNNAYDLRWGRNIFQALSNPSVVTFYLLRFNTDFEGNNFALLEKDFPTLLSKQYLYLFVEI